MRDRLIELIRNPIPITDGVTTFGERRLPLLDAERIADHLLANGVTVQEWISVEERLPVGADGKSTAEDVIAYLNNGEATAQVCTGWLSGDRWWLVVGDDDHHTAWEGTLSPIGCRCPAAEWG